MKFFSALLLGLLLGQLVPAPPLVAQDAYEVNPYDFVLIELLLGMQGAVIGEGIGVYATNQAITIANQVTQNLCFQPGPDLVTGCQIRQEARSLCIGSAIGVPLGATYLGLLMTKAVLDVDGNLLAALLGAMLGELLGLPQCSLFTVLEGLGVSLAPLEALGFSMSLNSPTNSDLSLLFNQRMLAAIGATLGYNLDRLLGQAPSQPAPTWQLTLPVFEFHF